MLLVELCYALHELKAPYGASTKYLCYYEKTTLVNAVLTKKIDFSGCHPGTETAVSVFMNVKMVRNININTEISTGSQQAFFGLSGQYSPYVAIEDSNIQFTVASEDKLSTATVLEPVANQVYLFGSAFQLTAKDGSVDDFFGLFSNTQLTTSDVSVDACKFTYEIRYSNSAYGIARVSGYSFLFNNSNVSALYTQPESCKQKGAASGLVHQGQLKFVVQNSIVSVSVNAVQTLYGTLFVNFGQGLDNCEATIRNTAIVANVVMTSNTKSIYVGGLGATVHATASVSLTDVDIRGNYQDPNSSTGFKNYIDSSAMFAAIDESVSWTAESVHIKLCGTNQYLPGESDQSSAQQRGITFEKCA